MTPQEGPIENVPAGNDSAGPVFTFTLREHWPWLAALGVLLLLIYLLAPIMGPFIIGAFLSYLGSPLVDRMQRLGVRRTIGVTILFLVFLGVLAGVGLLLVPRLEEQVVTLVNNIPVWLHWIQTVGLPRLHIHLPPGVGLDVDGLRRAIAEHLGEAGNAFTSVLGTVGHTTPAILEFVSKLLMIPLVTFYLLRDWDTLVVSIRDIVPRPLLPQVTRFARETDEVLSHLIRGQLLVMATLGFVYSTGLTLAGLDVGLLIGIMSGLVSFIPYLGFFSGLFAASIAMLVQTQSATSLIWVAVVYGIGEFLETGVLTPLLVGDRIGLHPVAVIFALLAGGQLFGFVGVLLSLPLSAIIAVLLRHLRQRWLKSALYRGRNTDERIVAVTDTSP
jgi:predicted PurR-regulated permease PerM